MEHGVSCFFMRAAKSEVLATSPLRPAGGKPLCIRRRPTLKLEAATDLLGASRGGLG